MDQKDKLSPVEGIKIESDYLRGGIAEQLLQTASNHFEKPEAQLLKFHGTYQQDDRELRTASHDGGKSEKQFSFMVRSRIPGGKLSAQQLLAHLDLCDSLGNSTLKITTRQGLQLHGISKGNLRECIQRINQAQLTTLAACGDVNRNTMCCPAPFGDPIRQQMQQLCDAIADHLAPATRAYYELWVKEEGSEEKVLAGGAPESEVVEPIYGKTYLPRKFKIGMALPEDNCIDIHTQDLGFLADVGDGGIRGFNVLVGGGFGMTPAAKKTFPALSQPMAWATPEQVVEVAEAVVKAQRDWGNRADRKVARLKYLIAERGVAWFRERVEEHLGYSLKDPAPIQVEGVEHHLGWAKQADGRWFYGLNVENGRLYDSDDRRWKDCFRAICSELSPSMRLTAQQSIIFFDLEADQRGQLEGIILRHGLPLSEQLTPARKWSMACVALPTCSLAITESERVLPGVIDQLDAAMAARGLEASELTVRMTGCPNGCARPYNADIAFVGKAKGRYTLYVGGNLIGTRLAFIFRDLVPLEELVPTLEPLFDAYRDQRLSVDERFGDFCDRVGLDQLLALSPAT
jgi:sulfite reductase (ferredoxin)